MLCITRKNNERFRIRLGGENVWVTIQIKRSWAKDGWRVVDGVKVCIDAAREVEILREELVPVTERPEYKE